MLLQSIIGTVSDIPKRFISIFTKIKILFNYNNHNKITTNLQKQTLYEKYTLLSAEDKNEIKEDIKFWIMVYTVGFITAIVLKFILTVSLIVAIVFGFTTSIDDEKDD